MNLYRILAGHISPKDSMMAISHYVVANDDAEVYEMVKDMFYLPKDLDEYVSEHLETDDEDEEKELREAIAEQYNEMEYASYYTPELIIKKRGNVDDEDQYEDAYYGGSVMKWEIAKEDITQEEIEMLKSLGIFEQDEIIKNRLLGISFC